MKDYMTLFLHATSEEKSNIAQLVVLIVRGHGGRFLGQMVGPGRMDGRLYKIGDENAEYKTRQCFYITRPESMEMRRIRSYNYYHAHKHEPEFKARLAKTRAMSRSISIHTMYGVMIEWGTRLCLRRTFSRISHHLSMQCSSQAKMRSIMFVNAMLNLGE